MGGHVAYHLLFCDLSFHLAPNACLCPTQLKCWFTFSVIYQEGPLMFLSLRSIFPQVQDFILPCEVKPDSVGCRCCQHEVEPGGTKSQAPRTNAVLIASAKKTNADLARVSLRPLQICHEPEWSINGQFAVTSCVVINNQHKQPLVENPSGLNPL